MTQSSSRQGSAIQPSVNQKRSLSRGLAIGAAVVVAAVLVAILQMGTSRATAPPAAVQFGCPGWMVVSIANVDCVLDGADAFGPAAASAEASVDLTLTGGRAPWCGPNHDVTIYGCSMERHKLDWPCGHSVSAVASTATATIASSGQTTGCASSLWLDALVLEASVLAGSDESPDSHCQVLIDPPDSCGPVHQGPCPEGQEFRRSTVPELMCVVPARP